MFEVEHASPRVGSVIRTTKEDMVRGNYAADIKRLLTERSALVFPQMHLTIDEQLAFAGTIGSGRGWPRESHNESGRSEFPFGHRQGADASDKAKTSTNASEP